MNGEKQLELGLIFMLLGLGIQMFHIQCDGIYYQLYWGQPKSVSVKVTFVHLVYCVCMLYGQS